MSFFSQGRALYSRVSDHETILELWGGSTKHPDSVFHFSDFHLSEFYEPEDQILPWVLECASKLNFVFHSLTLAEWICTRYEESCNALLYMDKLERN